MFSWRKRPTKEDSELLAMPLDEYISQDFSVRPGLSLDQISTKDTFYYRGVAIHLWRGDITTLKVDAIVNAANHSLLGGGGVDGAIHSAAGYLLREECSHYNGCETGEAVITKGYNLPCKVVIHTVGPQIRSRSHLKPTLLANCYRHSLEIMELRHLHSIAFCCISCGIYGYPLAPASVVALKTVFTHIFRNTPNIHTPPNIIELSPSVHPPAEPSDIHSDVSNTNLPSHSEQDSQPSASVDEPYSQQPQTTSTDSYTTVSPPHSNESSQQNYKDSTQQSDQAPHPSSEPQKTTSTEELSTELHSHITQTSDHTTDMEEDTRKIKIMTDLEPQELSSKTVPDTNATPQINNQEVSQTQSPLTPLSQSETSLTDVVFVVFTQEEFRLYHHIFATFIQCRSISSPYL